jgi:hypothetical protein
LITKFLLGAYIAIAAMAAIFAVMVAIRRHYDRVAAELAAGEEDGVLPSRNHAIVLLSNVHKPTLRAIAYAQATRPDTLTGLTVNVDENDTRRIQTQRDRYEIGVPLTVIDSPYREITRPIVDFVKSLRRDSPRDVVTVFIPEYVVGRWWEHLLHNQSALRIKGRLLFEPGVMVTSVPFQLASSSGLDLERYDQAMSRRLPRGPRATTRREGGARGSPPGASGRGTADPESAEPEPDGGEDTGRRKGRPRRPRVPTQS